MSFHCKSAGVIESVRTDLAKSNLPAGLKSDVDLILANSKRGCAYLEVHGHFFNEGGQLGKFALETFDATGVTELRDKLAALTNEHGKTVELLSEATANATLLEGQLKDAQAELVKLQTDKPAPAAEAPAPSPDPSNPTAS